MSLLAYTRHTAPFETKKHNRKYYQEHLVTALIAVVIIIFTYCHLTAGENQKTIMLDIDSNSDESPLTKTELLKLVKKAMIARYLQQHSN